MEVAAANPDPEWAVGFLHECWWSRVALPTLGSFSEEGKPLRLIQQSVAKDDPEPKAISCYGLYLPEIGDTWLRFVDGRPISSITTQFLEWSLQKLEEIGKKVLLLRFCSSGFAPHLGQRELACLQGGQALARKTQPPGQGERQRSWGEDRELPSSEAESVAERHRAEVGTRQAQGRRARRVAWSLRACG
jgi:hypothetical protein